MVARVTATRLPGFRLPLVAPPLLRLSALTSVNNDGRWVKAIVPVAATVMFLSGCGGASTLYSASTTASCLANAGIAPITSNADYIAQAASGGGYAIVVDGISVNVSFGRTVADAKRTASAYSIFAGDTPTSDILFRRGNAVIVWDSTPTSAERQAVEGCLG